MKQGRKAVYGAAKGMSRREQRTLLRLLVSSAILLLAVGGRILMPDALGGLRERLSQVMCAEMDVQEVFSAVGRAVSGGEESGGWEEVYRAVFSPEAGSAAPIAALVTPEDVSENPPCYSGDNTPERVSMTQELLGFAFAPPLAAAITSRFGIREDPITGRADFHYGLDLGAEEGTEIRAFADATVRTVGKSSILGNYLILDHANGFSTLYAHCSRVLVSAGDEPALGDVIAEVGQSGSATGPHLHFELHRRSQYLNPVYYVV